MKLQLLLQAEQENTSLGFGGELCLLQPKLKFLNTTDNLLLLLLQINKLSPHRDPNPGFQSKA